MSVSVSDAGSSVIKCNKLGKKFEDGKIFVNVFDAIDLSVAPGEMVAIVGASGSGKSTLLQLMGGLDKPTNGFVEINGQKISALNERKRCQLRNRSLGFIYQFHHLLPEFNAFENVCFPLLIAGESRKNVAEKARDMIAQVGLKDRATHRIGELSGGERQRIAIARALVHRPACVLADEPTGNLDQRTAEIIFELMANLNQAHQTSFVIVTHNDAIARRCHRVLTLAGGQLVG